MQVKEAEERNNGRKISERVSEWDIKYEYMRCAAV